MSITTSTKELRLDELTAIKLLYRLPQAQAMLLKLLLDTRVVTVEDIVEGGIAPTITTARVVVYRFRKFLAKHRLELEAQNSTGYWLSGVAKVKFSKELRDFIYSAR